MSGAPDGSECKTGQAGCDCALPWKQRVVKLTPDEMVAGLVNLINDYEASFAKDNGDSLTLTDAVAGVYTLALAVRHLMVPPEPQGVPMVVDKDGTMQTLADWVKDSVPDSEKVDLLAVHLVAEFDAATDSPNPVTPWAYMPELPKERWRAVARRAIELGARWPG